LKAIADYLVMMRSFLKILSGLFLFIFLVSCSNEEKPAKVSVETFFKNPQQSNFQISPDGKFISYLKPYQGKLNLFVQSLTSKASFRISSFTDQSVRNYFWASNTHLLYYKDNGARENFQLFSSVYDGSKTIKISLKPNTKVTFLDYLKYDSNDILLAINERNPENFDVYSLDLKTGKKILVEKNPGSIIDWIADNDGEIRMAIGSDGVTETLYYREKGSKAFKPVKSSNFINTLKPIGFSSKMHHIFALSDINRDKKAVVELNCLTGEETKVLYENKERDVLEVSYSRKSQSLNFAVFENPKREIYFFDKQLKDAFADIKKKLSNDEIRLIHKDQKEQHLIIRTFTDRDPGSYYFYNLEDRNLMKLADVNPDIKPSEMCEMKHVKFKNRDGLEIEGFLTLPKGRGSKNLPVVIYPHSGPNLRNSWAYSPEVQFFANRGYAVFQINFRGSTGFGKSFLKQGFKNWSKNIQHDITDGVNWLIKEELADANRIAIFGYSFGGFSALNQVVYNPNLYVCAASYSGYINLFTYLKGFPAYYKPYQQMLDVLIGNPEKDVEYLRYSSPVFQTNRIKTPLIIWQGGKDPKVNLSETNQFVKELRKNQVEVNYIVDKTEGHYLSDEKNKINFYTQVDLFFDKYLNRSK